MTLGKPLNIPGLSVLICGGVVSHSVVSNSSVTPWTVGCQAPLSIGIPRQEYWSGVPFPPPGDPPNLGLNLSLLHLLGATGVAASASIGGE